MDENSTEPTTLRKRIERMNWERIKEDELEHDFDSMEESDEEEALKKEQYSFSHSKCVEESVRIEDSVDLFATTNQLQKYLIKFKKNPAFQFKRDKDFHFVKEQLQCNARTIVKEEFKSIEETVMTNQNPFAFIKENILFLGNEKKKNKMWESTYQVVISYFFQLLFYRSKNFKTGSQELHELKEMINSMKNIDSQTTTQQAKKLKQNKTAQPDFFSTFNIDGKSKHWLVSFVVELQRKGLKPKQDHNDTFKTCLWLKSGIRQWLNYLTTEKKLSIENCKKIRVFGALVDKFRICFLEGRARPCPELRASNRDHGLPISYEITALPVLDLAKDDNLAVATQYLADIQRFYTQLSFTECLSDLFVPETNYTKDLCQRIPKCEVSKYFDSFIQDIYKYPFSSFAQAVSFIESLYNAFTVGKETFVSDLNQQMVIWFCAKNDIPKITGADQRCKDQMEDDDDSFIQRKTNRPTRSNNSSSPRSENRQQDALMNILKLVGVQRCSNEFNISTHDGITFCTLAWCKELSQEVFVKITSRKENVEVMNKVKSLEHEGICKIYRYEVIDSCYSARLFITNFYTLLEMDESKINVCELYVTIQEKLVPISESKLDFSCMLEQTLDVVEFLHSNNIVHSDLSLNNFMIRPAKHGNPKSRIVLIDFNNSFLKKECGCILYTGAELQLFKFPYTHPRKEWRGSVLRDTYALGIVVAEMLKVFHFKEKRFRFYSSSLEEARIQVLDYLKKVKDQNRNFESMFKFVDTLLNIKEKLSSLHEARKILTERILQPLDLNRSRTENPNVRLIPKVQFINNDDKENQIVRL
ncbi:hypothetical protein C9374_001464 [Naegleria lovaniensis]|uniref:Protein kinase domain-containing protein n=1 Tax=Naegleria lovaniensis TaxID=51637 RepID=A0AA88GVT5_NAELO|nr:uncharacterized protein C9374_001464 [Naegleria lovaniensis]KAG2387870.1 hypothetical protein C9374_001464 [Naegleria lovaniensis]